MSGGQAGVLPRGTAKRCQPLEGLGVPEQENLLSRVCRGWGLCSGVSSIWSSRRKPDDAEPFVAEWALTKEMGLRARSLPVWTLGPAPGSAPFMVLSGAWILGKGLEVAGALLIPDTWRRLPSVLMGSFV